MKLSVELSDQLLCDVRRVAVAEGVTLRELVERGLCRVVAEAKQPAGPFTLRKASFKGRGLRAELDDARRSRLRELAYEGRRG